MANKKKTSYMTAGEQVGGTILFLVYLLIMPLLWDALFRVAGGLLGITISDPVRNMIYYYVLFAVTLILFRDFLARTSRHLADNLGGACRSVLVGLVAFYGLNELVFRVGGLLTDSRANLNDTAISAQINDAPHMTLLIVIFLAPFVEEVLFRGLVFGCLKHKSRTVAYVVSCGLFAFLHVWQFAVVSQDVTYLLLMVQYLVPGLVLAWAYESSGTLWSAIGLHAVVNALSVCL